jgi:rhamnose utilization protein RhaD (predicted bifunctional aldolase and dehydrogenase)
MSSFKELAYIGKYLGSSLDLVQAGGGNISLKDEDQLIIKSSGCILSEIEENYGLSIVDLNKAQKFNETLDKIDEDKFGNELEKLLISKEYKRPSIETPFHSLISYKVVIHIHPIPVLALLSQSNTEELLRDHFDDYCLIPYATPGKKLAIEFKKHLDPKSKLIFMQNHGLVIAHNSSTEALELLEKVITKSCDLTKYKRDTFAQEVVSYLHKKHNIPMSVYTSKDEELVKLYNKNSYHPLCPDDVVYITHDVLQLIDIDEIDKYMKIFKTYPRVIFRNNTIYFLAKNTIKARQIYEQLYSAVKAKGLLNNNEYISKKEQEFLLNWEAEKYRQKKG